MIFGFAPFFVGHTPHSLIKKNKCEVFSLLVLSIFFVYYSNLLFIIEKPLIEKMRGVSLKKSEGFHEKMRGFSLEK